MDSIVLLHHSPDEWADKLIERLLALGCSAKYAARVVDEVRLYTKPTAVAVGTRWERTT